MKIKIGSKDLGIIVIPCFQSSRGIDFFDKEKRKDIKEKSKEEANFYNFEAKKEETILLKVGNQKVFLVGLLENYNLEDVRRAYSIAFRKILSTKENSVLFEVPNEVEETVVSVYESISLSSYKFDKYLSKKEKLNIEISLDISKSFSKCLSFYSKVCENVKIARDLVNENSDVVVPKKLADIVVEFAKKNKLNSTVLDEKMIKKEGLNLIHAVGRGSLNPPRLIICEYLGDPKSKEKTALVGKGITFDTGGVNLKPSGFLEDMKMDMGGAATVYSVFKSCVETNIKKNILLVIPAAENALSGNSYKPGDIFTSYLGKTVEIGNTDAEGRLVLADAISYVSKKYSPTSIIDVATLTGACMVALGPTLIAMMGNNEVMKKGIFDSGEKTYERVWELPIYEEHRDLIKSRFADIKNIGGKFGGAITAGAFLEAFVPNGVNWVHLDIAGAATTSKESYYLSDFATGKGVRLLVDYLKNN